jgi:hypothetical protein
MRPPAPCGAGSDALINRSIGGGSPRRPPHSMLGARNCKEKPQASARLASRPPEWSRDGRRKAAEPNLPGL